jgi:hypothetical protein
MIIYSIVELDKIGTRIDILDRMPVSWSPNNPKLVVLINSISYNIYTSTYTKLLKCYKSKDYKQCRSILYSITMDEYFKKAS